MTTGESDPNILIERIASKIKEVDGVHDSQR